MCILAWAVNCCAEFPFVFVHNRDEATDRATVPLDYDVDTPEIVWNRDVSVPGGGSWFGLHVPSGRFAALTNCRRAPTTCLDWDTIVKPRCRLLEPTTTVPWRLMFEPDRSRGTIIRDYLLHGREGLDHGVQYEGVNLLTTRLLRWPTTAATTRGGLPSYSSTNRYGMEQHTQIADGTVHVLSNSYLNNAREPKSVHLNSLVRRWLHHAPIRIGTTTARGAALAVEALHGPLLHSLGEIFSNRERLAGPEVVDEKDPVLNDSQPFLGAPHDELRRVFDWTGDETELRGCWSLDREREGQQSIYSILDADRVQTCFQTVVMQDAAANILVGVRRTHSPESHDPWVTKFFACPPQA